MSTLLPLAAVLGLANDGGTVYKELVRSANVLDIANADCQAILADLGTNLAAADPQQFATLVPYVTGTYGSAPSASGASGSASPFGAASGVGPGSFGAGQGLINRTSILNGGFYAFFEGIRKALATYGSSASVTNLSTYAAYQNGLTAYSCLFNPDTAALFWYAYNQAQQLAALSVFAPEGIVLGSFAITGSGAGTFVPGSFPNANGYVAAPLGVLCGLVTVTGVGTATLTDAAMGGGNAVAYAPAAITGTLTVTVTAPNQNAVSRTFTAALSNAAAEALVSFVPTVAGDLMSGAPTAVAVAGTASTGSVLVVAGGPGTDSYGNASWIGGLPMAQGFAPLKNPVIYVTEDCAGSGSSTVTVAAPNQLGVSENWTASLPATSVATTSIALSPTTSGDRMGGAPTSITISAGAVTFGAFQVQSGAAERAY